MTREWQVTLSGTLANAVLAAAVVAGLQDLAPEARAQRASEPGPFAGLAGSWTGNGTVSLSNGSNERIRCRAVYAVLGERASNLRQSLRCASDSYKFDLNSDVVYAGGTVTGSWNETNRGAVGSVSGKATPGSIQARVTSPIFSADLSLVTQGDRQQVSIQSPGSELSAVSITLNRAGK